MSRLLKWWVVAAVAVLTAGAMLFAYGCQSEDPAAEFAKAQGAPPAASKAPAATPSTSDGGPTAAAGGEKAPATDAEEGKEPAAAAKPSSGGAAAPAGEAGKDAVKEGADKTAAGEKTEAGADKDKGEAKEPKAGGEDEEAKADEKEAGAKDKAEAKDKGKKGEDKEGGITEDERITDFAKLDPRDIIVKKYEAMAAKHTRPWDPEKDVDDFIPETGRIDPLNPVNSAIPDELKPPRSGETDQNEIETYLIAIACTAAVDQVRSMLQVRNVLKIGAVKYVTLALGSGPEAQGGTVEVGQSFNFFAGMMNFVPIQVTLSVDSASEDEVVITVSASGVGTSTTVSKSTAFIPVRYSG